MNMMAGHEFLKKNFNTTTKVVWHADAFGHAAASPELYSKLGFESIFFGRIDDEEKNYRKGQKSLEFVW